MRLTKWIRFWYWLNYGKPKTWAEWWQKGGHMCCLDREDRFRDMEKRRKKAKDRLEAASLPFAGACGTSFRVRKETT